MAWAGPLVGGGAVAMAGTTGAAVVNAALASVAGGGAAVTGGAKMAGVGAQVTLGGALESGAACDSSVKAGVPGAEVAGAQLEGAEVRAGLRGAAVVCMMVRAMDSIKAVMSFSGRFAKLAPAGTRLANPCINGLGARAGASGFGLAGVLGRGCVASSVGRIEAGLAEAEVGGSSVEAVSGRFLCYEACRKGSQGSHSTHMTLQETTMHERREKLEDLNLPHQFL